MKIKDQLPIVNSTMARHMAIRIIKGNEHVRGPFIQAGSKEYEELKPPYPWWIKGKKGDKEEDNGNC